MRRIGRPRGPRAAGRRARPRKPWQPPQLVCYGQLRDLVRGGGGKLSSLGGDQGDARKQSGGG
jgi:hypothetical protein